MTQSLVPFIPENAPFNTEQRAWLNGFLAGLFAQMPAGQTPLPQLNGASQNDGEPLLVLFGSQTGTAEGLAKRLAKEAQQRGFAPSVLALNDYEKAKFSAANKAIIISSTWGDGDPPENAANFWDWLKSDAALRLENLQFAVLGLGDRNYSDFCGASKKFDARLEALGAKRLVPRGECDVDYETPAKSWSESVLNILGSAGVPPAAAGVSPDAHLKGNRTVSGVTPDTARETRALPFNRNNPFLARLLKNVLLNKPGPGKEVHHYEISLAGSGLAYEVGDALGVMPVNCPALVEEITAALKCRGEEPVKVGKTEIPLREALLRHLDITKPSQEFFATVVNAALSGELAGLLALEKDDELKQWLYGRGVIDLLLLLDDPPSAADFVRLVKKLTPRLYSISSSPKAHPGEVHLTVSAVRYESFGRSRKGVASTFLADRAGDAEFVKVFVQPSHGFKLPPSGNTPIVMIGPGTGIAPFRAFLEERQAIGAKGKNWLFFSDQKRATDFRYEEQLTAWHNSGFLTRLDLAFSRDQAEKIYVQHQMLKNAGELWSWLEAGAHFYVCGDASRMAKDVDAALHQIIEKLGGKSTDEAKAYVAKLKADKRYQRDVY